MRFCTNGIVLMLLLSSRQWAFADIILTPDGRAAATTSGFDYVAFLLDVTGSDIGSFDTMEIQIDTTQGAPTPIDATTTTADTVEGADTSGFNLWLTVPTAVPGGFGLSPFGVTETASQLSGTFASLGNNSASELGTDVFIAQVVLPDGFANSGGTYSFTFFDDSQIVAIIEGPWGVAIPEPSMLPVFCLLAVVWSSRFRRRRRNRASPSK